MDERGQKSTSKLGKGKLETISIIPYTECTSVFCSGGYIIKEGFAYVDKECLNGSVKNPGYNQKENSSQLVYPNRICHEKCYKDLIDSKIPLLWEMIKVRVVVV